MSAQSRSGKTSFNVIRLGENDVDDLIALESLCFAYHWTREQFLLGLERNAFVVFGIREAERLVGYIAFSVILDEMEILNIAVHPDARRRGMGAVLLESALAYSREKQVAKSFLDVKESNAPAIALYEKYGYKQIGVRKKYYPDTREDALLYRCDL